MLNVCVDQPLCSFHGHAQYLIKMDGCNGALPSSKVHLVPGTLDAKKSLSMVPHSPPPSAAHYRGGNCNLRILDKDVVVKNRSRERKQIGV